MRTSSLRDGSVADDAASTSTPRPVPSLSTDATAANNSYANLHSHQKRSSLLAVPTRTSSKNQQPTVDASGNTFLETGSTSRKRRKRKDGDGSSVNTGHSTTEGRPHKPQHGGGISKFFSVFLNCCRAPDNSGDAARISKPRAPRSVADVPGPKNTSLKDSGVDTESKDKDVVMDEKKGDIIQAEGDARLVDTREAENQDVIEKLPIGQDETVEKPQTLPVEPPMTAEAADGEALRPSTCSPVPQPILSPTKEDVVMADEDVEVPQDRIKIDIPPTQTHREEEQEAVKPPTESTHISDEQTQDATMGTPASAQKQWLLPPVKPDMQEKKCLVLDLDETLVHSSFKVNSNFRKLRCMAVLTKLQHIPQADFTIPVEIEGAYHNVYVIKRPGVDQFMKRVGELYEVVVFTASVSKVSGSAFMCKQNY